MKNKLLSTFVTPKPEVDDGWILVGQRDTPEEQDYICWQTLSRPLTSQVYLACQTMMARQTQTDVDWQEPNQFKNQILPYTMLGGMPEGSPPPPDGDVACRSSRGMLRYSAFSESVPLIGHLLICMGALLVFLNLDSFSQANSSCAGIVYVLSPRHAALRSAQS